MDFRTKFRTLTVLPFLAAVMIASALSPLTNVVIVNAREMGTEYAQPWRHKSLTGLARECRTQLLRFKDTCASILGHPFATPALAGLALLAAAVIDPNLAAVGMLPIVGKVDIKALKQTIIDANLEIDGISAAVAKDKRKMTDDERAKLADAKQRKADAQELIAEAEERNAREAAATPDGGDGDTTAALRAANGAGVQVGRLLSDEDPKRGFRSHNEQMACIMVAAETGRVDSRLVPLAAAGGDEQGGHTNPHGGFLLAPAFSPDLLSVAAEEDPTAMLVRRVPMTADRVVFNARVDKNHTTSVSGGLTVSRTPQTQAATASRMEFEQVELVAHDLCGVAHATNRILQTSPTSFLTLLQTGMRDEFRSKMLDERLNGTGNAEFKGIITDDATITVPKETGQDADTINFDNVNKMRARQWRYGRSIWLANNDTLPQVTTLYMPIGTGGERVPIYAPGDEAAPQGRLLGRPIYFTEFCQKLGDKGDIINACFSEYLEGALGGEDPEMSSSIHVRFLNREQTFLFVLMNDAKPWWRSPLTPKYSAVTLSPFVTLAARA
jgi:HK97 family phage major capsid protein